jgi:hypothetical protein
MDEFALVSLSLSFSSPISVFLAIVTFYAPLLFGYDKLDFVEMDI